MLGIPQTEALKGRIQAALNEKIRTYDFPDKGQWRNPLRTPPTKQIDPQVEEDINSKLRACRAKSTSFERFVQFGKEIDATLDHEYSELANNQLAEEIHPVNYELRRTLYRNEPTS
jgi:hypothetical protein